MRVDAGLQDVNTELDTVMTLHSRNPVNVHRVDVSLNAGVAVEPFTVVLCHPAFRYLFPVFESLSCLEYLFDNVQNAVLAQTDQNHSSGVTVSPVNSCHVAHDARVMRDSVECPVEVVKDLSFCGSPFTEGETLIPDTTQDFQLRLPVILACTVQSPLSSSQYAGLSLCVDFNILMMPSSDFLYSQ